jgi:DNA-directed RNA polymerase sigma subunit (sigma70/sigma32)
MSQPEPSTVEQQRAIFRFLIEAQDAGQSVPESRKATAERYGVSEERVKEIEREGIDQQWPPL